MNKELKNNLFSLFIGIFIAAMLSIILITQINAISQKFRTVEQNAAAIEINRQILESMNGTIVENKKLILELKDKIDKH